MNGILNRVSDYNAPTTVWWQLNAENERGIPIDESLGNGVRMLSNFDSLTGHLSNRRSGTSAGSYANHQNTSFAWDKNENLTERSDALQSGSGCLAAGLCESFTHDALNRLTQVRLNGGVTMDLQYNAAGDITSKTGIGTYTYDSVRKHAVTSTGNGWSFAYDTGGNVVLGHGQTVTYTSYEKPSSITEGSLYSQFSYTPSRDCGVRSRPMRTGRPPPPTSVASSRKWRVPKAPIFVTWSQPVRRP